MAYQAIQVAFNSVVNLVITNDTSSSPTNSPSNKLLNQFLPSNEDIREIMCLEELPWENSH